MADQPLTGHAPFTPIKVRGETTMADPQHPATAAPTLAQMPALIAKHDEFAALAAEHGHGEMAALHAVTAAALRTLTRPVEDEEARQLDALRAEFDQLFGRFTDESARATRAEQERDRLRFEMDKLAVELASHQEWNGPTLAARVRALAAAAGTEEPRSARPISEQTQADLKALDEAAGMGRHRLRGFLTGNEEPR